MLTCCIGTRRAMEPTRSTNRPNLRRAQIHSAPRRGHLANLRGRIRLATAVGGVRTERYSQRAAAVPRLSRRTGVAFRHTEYEREHGGARSAAPAPATQHAVDAQRMPRRRRSIRRSARRIWAVKGVRNSSDSSRSRSTDSNNNTTRTPQPPGRLCIPPCAGPYMPTAATSARQFCTTSPRRPRRSSSSSRWTWTRGIC